MQCTRISTAFVWLVLASFAPLMAQETVWQADFNKPNGEITAYQTEIPATFELHTGDIGPTLLARTQGNSALEGIQIRAEGLPEGRLVTFVAELKGMGEIWPMVLSGNGWLYSPELIALGDQWQTVKITKPLGVNDSSASFTFVTKTPRKIQFEVRNVSAVVEATPELFDREVAPIRLNASDFVIQRSCIEQMAGSIAPKVAANTTSIVASGIPCPRTLRPIYAYLRVKAPETAGYFSLVSRAGSAPQRLNRYASEPTDDWQWIGAGPVAAGQFSDQISVQYFGPKNVRSAAAIDAIVLTTVANPGVEELNSAPVLAMSAKGQLSIAPTAVSPVIDGRPDDLCWTLTPSVSNFAVRGEHRPASQASEMRLCYDEKYLYWFFRGTQEVLFGRNNEIHEFKRNITQRDAEVWKDDCVILMLQPDGSDSIFDVWVNAAGAVNDAVMPATSQNLWSARDSEFNIDAEFENEIGEGYWTVEGRISFESIGVAAPSAGDVWGIMLGRLSQKPKETSAWNLLEAGFHDAAAFAEAVFLDEPVGASVTVPTELQLGGNMLTANTRSSADRHGFYVFGRLSTEQRREDIWTYSVTDAVDKQVEQEFSVTDEGAATLTYGLVDAVSLKPIIVSPALPRNIKSSSAEVLVDSEGPYRLYLNGAVLASGNGGGTPENCQALLQKGINSFGIELQHGTARVAITAAGQTIETDRGWRMAPPEASADFTATDIDTAQWQPARVTSQKTGSRIDAGGAGARFRLNVLWEESRIYPNSKPAFYVARDSDQHLTIITPGLPGRLLDDFRIHLALPSQLTTVGATAYYQTTGYQPCYSVSEGEPLQFEGRTYQHYIISADKPLKHEAPVRIMGLMNAYIRYNESIGAPDESTYTLYYGVEALDGNFVEIMQPLTVSILPPLDGMQPEKLVWQLWGSFFGPMNQASMKEAAVATMARAGFNNLVAGDETTSEIGPRYGVANLTTVSFDSWSIDVAPWLEQHPADVLIRADGHLDKKYICSTVLIEDAAEYISTRLHSLLKERGATWVNWDYESGVTSGWLSCYCPRCIAGFRAYAGLPEDVVLTADIIQQSYMPQWTDYMNYKMARIALTMSDAVHTYNPDYKYTVYSGYHSEDTKWRYGVDWKMIADLKAVDMALCGYGRSYEALKDTREALGGIPLVTGYLIRPYARSSNDLLIPPTRAVLLRRLFDSTGGILIYDRMPCEGRTYTASAQASQVASTFEDIFRFGEFIAIDGVPEDAEWLGARRLGERMLVGVFNVTSEEKSYSFVFPDGYSKAIEFYSGDVVDIDTEMAVTLEAGGAAVYVLSN